MLTPVFLNALFVVCGSIMKEFGCVVWILKALCELIAMSIDMLPALILVVVLWGGLISLGE